MSHSTLSCILCHHLLPQQSISLIALKKPSEEGNHIFELLSYLSEDRTPVYAHEKCLALSKRLPTCSSCDGFARRLSERKPTHYLMMADGEKNRSVVFKHIHCSQANRPSWQKDHCTIL